MAAWAQRPRGALGAQGQPWPWEPCFTLFLRYDSPVGARLVPREQASPPSRNVTVRGGWHPKHGAPAPRGLWGQQVVPGGHGQCSRGLLKTQCELVVCRLGIMHFSNGVLCLYATSLAVVLYGCGPLTYKQLILTSAGVRDAEALAVPCQSCLVLSSLGAASAGAHLEKVTVVSGNKQPTTKLCFIWEEHPGGFQELQNQLLFTSLCWGGQSTVQS